MQLVALAKNPIPGGVVVGELVARDGTKLRFARWEATRGPRRGTVWPRPAACPAWRNSSILPIDCASSGAMMRVSGEKWPKVG